MPTLVRPTVRSLLCRITTYASLDHRRSRLPSSRFASLELSSADRHVTAVTVRGQATAQHCAVCSLLQPLLLMRHTFAPRPRLMTKLLYGVLASSR